MTWEQDAVTVVDTQPPNADRQSPAKSHDMLWGDEPWDEEAYSELEEADLCDCDQCEGYAEYCIDLKMGGMRREALATMAQAGDEVAARLLANEEAEYLDRSTLRYQLQPWIRYADTDSHRVPEAVAYLVRSLDGPGCRLCGGEETAGNPHEVDHVRPLADGGTDHLSNLWTLCRPCNRAKGCLGLEAFLLPRKHLRVRPAANRNHWPLGFRVSRP